MQAVRTATIVLARIFLSLIFILSGAGKLFHWHETETLVMNTLCDWQAHVGFSQTAQECVASLILWTPLLTGAAIVFEFIGGLLLLFGFREKWGTTLLVLVLIPATILFHSFWFLEGSERGLQQIMFLKNLAILGGLLMVLVHGGKTSRDTGFSGL